MSERYDRRVEHVETESRKKGDCIELSDLIVDVTYQSEQVVCFNLCVASLPNT